MPKYCHTCGRGTAPASASCWHCGGATFALAPVVRPEYQRDSAAARGTTTADEERAQAALGVQGRAGPVPAPAPSPTARPTPARPTPPRRADPPAVAPASAAPQVVCPKCGSGQLTAQKRGFGALKALAGGFVAGPAGLLAGFHKARRVDVTCIRCGHSWQAGS